MQDIDCKKSDNLLQWETSYSEVDFHLGSPTSGDRLLHDRLPLSPELTHFVAELSDFEV